MKAIVVNITGIVPEGYVLAHWITDPECIVLVSKGVILLEFERMVIGIGHLGGAWGALELSTANALFRSLCSEKWQNSSMNLHKGVIDINSVFN